MWVNAAARADGPNPFSTDTLSANCGTDGVRWQLQSNGTFSAVIGSNTSGCVYNFTSVPETTSLIPLAWHHIAVSWNVNQNSESVYYDGALAQSVSQGNWPDSYSDVKIGLGRDTQGYWNGQVDEVRMSTSIRSADWVATEFNNQNSLSTFYAISSENGASLNLHPTTANLYAGQSQQLTGEVVGDCSNPSVTWSVSPAGVGTVTATGLYTAPGTIPTYQTVTVTAADQNNGSVTASATLTLMPAVSLSVVPNVAAVGATGEHQPSPTDPARRSRDCFSGGTARDGRR